MANLFVRFERGRDDVTGPTLGPFAFVQQTYDELRASPDGAPIAAWNKLAYEWFIVDGEHEGEFYSDFVVYARDAPDDALGPHDCAAGRVTTNDGVTEERWDHEARRWTPTGRVRNPIAGAWTRRPEQTDALRAALAEVSRLTEAAPSTGVVTLRFLGEAAVLAVAAIPGAAVSRATYRDDDGERVITQAEVHYGRLAVTALSETSAPRAP